MGWPQSTNGGGSGLTTTAAAAAGSGPAAPGACWLTLNVPMPPGSACFVVCCCLSAPDGADAAGFSSGCRKSCVFRKKPAAILCFSVLRM